MLRALSPVLSSVGLGSIGRVATKITNPLTHAIGGMFNFGKNMVGNVLGGLGGAARTAASVVTSPFRMLSSPFFMVSALAIGGLVVYTITRR